MNLGSVKQALQTMMAGGEDTKQDPRMEPVIREEAKNLCHTCKETVSEYRDKDLLNLCKYYALGSGNLPFSSSHIIVHPERSECRQQSEIKARDMNLSYSSSILVSFSWLQNHSIYQIMHIHKQAYQWRKYTLDHKSAEWLNLDNTYKFAFPVVLVKLLPVVPAS